MQEPYLIKYKPNRFSDILIDDNIKDIIKTLINMNHIFMLIIGDGETGKTTLVNSIVKEYFCNDIDYEDNVLIINSLKEQGIQYYKNDVKTFCQTRCSIKDKNKIIVIDDIDNINSQGQCIFRNCLDKYENQVHFIMTCQNVQKVLQGIQCRVMIVKLNKISDSYLINIAKEIVIKEKIDIDDECLNFLLKISNNSIKILLNYLDKLALLECKITKDIINNNCTNIEINDLEMLTKFCLVDNNLLSGIEKILEIFNKGYSVLDILDGYYNYIKLCKMVEDYKKYEAIKIICKYITIVNTVHDNELELYFLVNNLVKIDNNKLKEISYINHI